MKQLPYQADITIQNAVHCAIPRDQARFISESISYEKTYWRQGPFKKEQHKYKAYFFTHKSREYSFFLTGHLKRVLFWCKENGVRVKVSGTRPSQCMDPFRRAPILPNITLRPDQVELVNEALRIKRGVIKAPTRTGKTVIQYAIVSAYNGINTLFLAHTKDLVNQLADEGKRFGFNIARFVGEHKDLNWAEKDQVVVMTRQSCANLIKRNHPLADYFNMIVIDEAHHVTSPDGQYAKILTHIKAPLRYGFTATMPDSVESSLSLEGYVGPIVGELTIEEAINKDILVKPKMIIRKAPHSRIAIQTKYADVYDKGIVNNLNRNKMIADITKEYVDNGSSVLILVNKILHGHNIETELREIFVPAYYVQGETETKTRDWVKRNLIAKRIMCVIATTVWKEGINIPSLNVCINAAGGKSEISTLQSVGRSLTKTEGKDHAVIVDLFDPSHHYLISHFGERIILYTDQGWM